MVGSIRQDWVLWFLFILALVVSVGWAAEWWRNENALEALIVTKAATLEAVLKNAESIMSNSQRIDGILKEHNALLEAQREGPRNTACDAAALLFELRKRGISIPRQPVEDRCNTQ